MEQGGDSEPLDLLERSQALEELGRLAAEAASGRGRLVLVAGEAGIGKTALVRRFCEALPSRARVLWGSCDPSSLPRPLGPLIDVAAALDEGFEQSLDLEAPRGRLFAALRDILAASTHVLVVEDAHWADDATLARRLVHSALESGERVAREINEAA